MGVAFPVLCSLYLTVPVILLAEVQYSAKSKEPRVLEPTVTYVTQRGIHTCTCPPDVSVCEEMESSKCHSCEETQKVPEQKHLTVWFTSALHVARLLNNSEVRHLSLVQCVVDAQQKLSFQFFTVLRLNTLWVRYPLLQLERSFDFTVGKARGLSHHHETGIAVIHASVLTGDGELKAYTVQAKVGLDGLTAFPHVFVPFNGLCRIMVTFLY